MKILENKTKFKNLEIHDKRSLIKLLKLNLFHTIVTVLVD